ncbi:MAG: hypothetical protein E6J40_07910 [Chloroflexi bacterium]|nr:MAG: hypothetical protein E6J40_07910 [Chloroflexota bacterium]
MRDGRSEFGLLLHIGFYLSCEGGVCRRAAGTPYEEDTGRAPEGDVRHVPHVRWHRLVPSLELPHHHGISSVPVLQQKGRKVTDNTTKITAPPPPIVYPPYHTVRRYSGTSQVALSPDGRTLAVASRKDGPAVVCEVSVDGGELRRAFDIEGASVHGLSWSQSGELYCTAHRGGTERWQVYVRRKDGRVEDFAVSEGDRVQHHLSRAAASPDGQRVAIGTNAREPADVDIAIVDARSKAQRLAVSGPAWHVAGSWSPDGRWLAVMRVTQNTDQDLLAVEDESGEVIEVTTHQGEMQNVPAGWLADGRMLAITDHGSEFLHLEALDLR